MYHETVLKLDASKLWQFNSQTLLLSSRNEYFRLYHNGCGINSQWTLSRTVKKYILAQKQKKTKKNQKYDNQKPCKTTNNLNRNNKQRSRSKVWCFNGVNGLSHDEYVTTYKNKMVWTCGNHIIKSFNLESAVPPNTEDPMSVKTATCLNPEIPISSTSESTKKLLYRDNAKKRKKDNIYEKIPFFDNYKHQKRHKNRNDKMGMDLDDNENNNENNNKNNAQNEASFDDNDNSDDILKVIWCNFAQYPSCIPKRSLCILQRQLITIVSNIGDIYYVPLPRIAKDMWALPEGVLVESLSFSNESNIANGVLTPIYFSLLHSLEELKPIALHLMDNKTKAIITQYQTLLQPSHLVMTDISPSFSRSYQSSSHDPNPPFRTSIDPIMPPPPNTCSNINNNHNNNNNRLNNLNINFTRSHSKNNNHNRNRIGNFGSIYDGIGHGDYFFDSNETIVFTSVTQPFIITFNTKYHCHTLWIVRQDRKQMNLRLNSGTTIPIDDTKEENINDDNIIDTGNVDNFDDNGPLIMENKHDGSASDPSLLEKQSNDLQKRWFTNTQKFTKVSRKRSYVLHIIVFTFYNFFFFTYSRFHPRSLCACAFFGNIFLT